MEITQSSFFVALQRCAQDFLLTRPWGVMIDHLSLAHVFEQIEKTKITKNRDLYRACIGSQIKLLDKQALTVSTVTLTEPDESDVDVGKLSCLSMLGSELFGAETGQNISVDVLGRTVKFQVLSIHNTQVTQRR